MEKDKKVFTYPVLYRYIFRYGNIPATILLSFYLVTLLIRVDKELISLLPIIITLLMIYFLNKGYLNLYKLMPYKIETDDKKMMCSNFLFRRKEMTIYFEDIEKLSGGVFDGSLRGIMKVCDSKSKMCIGYYNKIRESQTLNAIILSKVKRDIYDEVLRKTGFKNNSSSKK